MFILNGRMKSNNQELFLPLELQRRINRLIPIDDVLQDKPICSQVEDKHLSDVNVSANVSMNMRINISLHINQFQELECFIENDILRFESPSNLKSPFIGKTNWLDEFCRQTQKDRVKWNSKLHHSKSRFTKKTMYEQAEDLIDIVRLIFFIFFQLKLMKFFIYRQQMILLIV